MIKGNLVTNLLSNTHLIFVYPVPTPWPLSSRSRCTSFRPDPDTSDPHLAAGYPSSTSPTGGACSHAARPASAATCPATARRDSASCYRESNHHAVGCAPGTVARRVSVHARRSRSGPSSAAVADAQLPGHQLHPRLGVWRGREEPCRQGLTHALIAVPAGLPLWWSRSHVQL